ncbi:hypothetical protein [Shewanella vesiculosa]|uniref:hypothetical protein n=1 Tax=Shewanella vesiculosa TaxID=518738 RepID=UPI00384DA7B6
MKKNHILAQLRKQFAVHKFIADNLTIIHQGRFANAIVYRYHDGQYDLVIKDFSHSPLFIRKTFGRLSIHREYKALKSLCGLPGISDEYYRLSSISLAYTYIEGVSLGTLRKNKQQLPVSFFHEWEYMSIVAAWCISTCVIWGIYYVGMMVNLTSSISNLQSIIRVVPVGCKGLCVGLICRGFIKVG